MKDFCIVITIPVFILSVLTVVITFFIGTPSRARFFERYLKNDDKTIVLKWEVESFSPITAYEVKTFIYLFIYILQLFISLLNKQ